MFQTMFFGRKLITDNEILYQILSSGITEGENSITSRIEREFPDLLSTAVACIKEVERWSVRVEILIYLNHRVQAWAGHQFDCEPSSVRFVAQAGQQYEKQPAG